MGPFQVLRQTAPNTYQLDLPPTWKAVNEFNVSRLRRYHRRPDWMGSEAVVPAPVVVSADRPPEHEVQEILRFRSCRGRPQCLVRWVGKDASGDTWEPVEHLANCESALRDFEAAQGISVPRPQSPPGPAGPRPGPVPPPGFSIEPNPPPDDPSSLLVGRKILYYWPSEGWQLGSVARLCTKQPFSHVVAYQRKTSALRGTADSLLDSACYGDSWVLLSGPPAVGARPAGRRRAQQ